MLWKEQRKTMNFLNVIAMAFCIILSSVLVYFICLCIVCTTVGIIKGIKKGFENKTKSVQEDSEENTSQNKTNML